MTTASLRLLVTNAFGLLSKLGEFQNNLSSTKPDIAIVTETKFTPDKVPLAMSTIPGYAAPIRQDRTASGGGVAVWVKSNLHARHLDTIDCKGFEAAWLLVESCSHGKVVVCAVYRSGSSSPSDCSVIDYL
eukprot:scpid109180/ scgid29982/ 